MRLLLAAAALVALLSCRGGPSVSKAAQAAGVEWVPIPDAGYALARTEITLSQFAACVADGGCAPYKLEGIEWKERPWERSDRCLWARRAELPDHPINCIDWHQADAFCRWVGGRLPTRVEWVREASADGTRIYPWGDEPPTCEVAVMDDWQSVGGFSDRRGCGTGGPMAVCSRPAGNSVHGLCDLGGNVTEWTATQELSETPPRYNLGGSYANSGSFLQARFELINPTGYRNDSLGARCLLPR